MPSNRLRADRTRVSWRRLGDASLLVVRGNDDLFRLNPAGTAVWSRAQEIDGFDVSQLWHVLPEGLIARRPLEELLDALVGIGALTAMDETATSGSGASGGSGPLRSPFLRRIPATWELVERTEIAADCLTVAVGEGFVVHSRGRSLSLLTAEAAIVWRVLERGGSTFVELLDELEIEGVPALSSAERVLSGVLRELVGEGAVRGLEHVAEYRVDSRVPVNGLEAAPPPAGVEASLSVGVRRLGSFEAMAARSLSRPFDSLGLSPVVSDVMGSPSHIVVVCQYGIHGIAPGVEPYTQSCIATLRRMRPDLIIVSGGGRHGHGSAREADSVVDWYRDQLPEVPLWLEKYSTTSWENIQYSLEMISSRELTPTRVSVVCDRARSEKMRLACWLVRPRIHSLPGVELRVVPLTRTRSTWRDNRLVQAALGVPQLLREMAGSRDSLSEEVA